MLKHFNSLPELFEAFPDEEACIAHLRSVRWPNGVVCPICEQACEPYELKNHTFKCDQCYKKFSVRKNTIFEDSKLPLQKWFAAIFLATSHKKGVSSCQLAKDIGIRQKAAWFMLHRIRTAADTKSFREPMSGTIEVDEAFVGGNPKFMHAKKRPIGLYGMGAAKKKKIIFGMAQRGGELRLGHVRHYGRKITEPIIRENVAPGSEIHTDEGSHYDWMRSEYAHRLVAHSLHEYVRGDVHTNTVEGAFGHFKRGVVGVYHKASDKHLDRYLQMFAFRWNRRDMGEGQRVNDLLRLTDGRRITYKQLIS